MKNNPIKTTKSIPSPIISWKDNISEVSDQISQSINAIMPIQRASGYNRFRDTETNLSVRDQFTRKDYEYFRSAEALPCHFNEILLMCNNAYKKIGLVRHVIDLMGDFGSRGVRLVHPIPEIQLFYNYWFKIIQGKQISERFLNLFYRLGNVIIRRNYAKLSKVDREKLYKGLAAQFNDSQYKWEVPIKYTFFSPLSVTQIGDDLVGLGAEPLLALKISESIVRKLKSGSKEDKKLLESVPADIKQMLLKSASQKHIILDNTSLYCYKKDDWESWGTPILNSILNDLIMLEKTKLADIAALDGAISHIRLWKLGDLKEKMYPTKAAVDKLSNLLLANTGGGSFDLIWGPELTFEETSTDLSKFLGEEKYQATYKAIYDGLGIPSSLTASGGEKGFTNNFISLKILLEKLQYGRDTLTSFWESEIKFVQKAMGFKKAASLRFDRMSLQDESAEKALLIQLADRNLISMETLREHFGEVNDIEESRVKKEVKKRGENKVPAQISPYSIQDFELKKLFVGQGIVTPSEMGIELQPKKSGEVAPIKLQQKVSGVPKDRVGKGRPITSKDTKKRKQKVIKPRVSVKGTTNLYVWAKSAQRQISEIINPAYLNSLGKANLRQLSTADNEKLEHYKFVILCNIQPFTKIDQDCICGTIKELVYSKHLKYEYDKSIKEFKAQFGTTPSIDDCREIKISVYINNLEVQNG